MSNTRVMGDVMFESSPLRQSRRQGPGGTFTNITRGPNAEKVGKAPIDSLYYPLYSHLCDCSLLPRHVTRSGKQLTSQYLTQKVGEFRLFYRSSPSTIQGIAAMFKLPNTKKIIN